jgi:Fe-S-cluster-containing hydrogenase component 2
MLQFYETHCDNCLGRNEVAPPCVASCKQGALEYRMLDPVETDVHIVDEFLAARTQAWVKEEVTT